MNWRILVGLAFLIVGIGELYALLAHKAATGSSSSSFLAGLGCMIWVAVGVFLIIQAMRKVEK